MKECEILKQQQNSLANQAEKLLLLKLKCLFFSIFLFKINLMDPPCPINLVNWCIKEDISTPSSK